MHLESNPAILKKYILVPERQRTVEYPIVLTPAPSYLTPNDTTPEYMTKIIAIYEPTGRGPYIDEQGERCWEYEYKGVRVR
jgi:hypothetical protein